MHKTYQISYHNTYIIVSPLTINYKNLNNNLYFKSYSQNLRTLSFIDIKNQNNFYFLVCSFIISFIKLVNINYFTHVL